MRDVSLGPALGGGVVAVPGLSTKLQYAFVQDLGHDLTRMVSALRTLRQRLRTEGEALTRHGAQDEPVMPCGRFRIHAEQTEVVGIAVVLAPVPLLLLNDQRHGLHGIGAAAFVHLLLEAWQRGGRKNAGHAQGDDELHQSEASGAAIVLHDVHEQARPKLPQLRRRPV
jgi:hypothetical protein